MLGTIHCTPSPLDGFEGHFVASKGHGKGRHRRREKRARRKAGTCTLRKNVKSTFISSVAF